MKRDPDFYYREEGTLTLLYPKTETARSWARENLHRDPWQDKDEDEIAIEPRMFEDILDGIQAGGFTISLMI